MKISYSRETLSQVRESGVEALLYKHWKEIAHYTDIPLCVDWLKYETAESLNKLRIFTARADGQLIGYGAYLVDYNSHYRSSLQAVQDVLYLETEHRHGRIGYRMVAYADQALAAEGVQAVYHHEKLAHPSLGRLLENMGYRAVDRLWTKRLDQD